MKTVIKKKSFWEWFLDIFFSVVIIGICGSLIYFIFAGLIDSLNHPYINPNNYNIQVLGGFAEENYQVVSYEQLSENCIKFVSNSFDSGERIVCGQYQITNINK